MPKDTPLVKASGGGQATRPRKLSVAPRRVDDLRSQQADRRRMQAEYLLKRIDSSEDDEEREFLWNMVKNINQQEVAQEQRSRDMPVQTQLPTGGFISVPKPTNSGMPASSMPQFKNPYSDPNYRPEFINQQQSASPGITPENLLNNNPFYKYDLSK